MSGLTKEQLELRRSGIGASEIATIVGVGSGSLIELYGSKVLPRSDETESDEALLARELGTVLEDPVAQIYARRTKTFLAPAQTFRHPTRSLAIATPDRARFLSNDAFREALSRSFARSGDMPHGILDLEAVSNAERLVEVKTHAARYRRDYGPAGSEIVPEDKAIQVTWQMGVTGLQVCDLPVLFRGDWGCSLEVFTVHFNQALFDGLYEAAERFWFDHVAKKVPPEPDGSDRYDEFLARAFPTNTQPPFPASEQEEELMMRYAKLREVERRADALKKVAKQQLVSIIGGADGITSARYGKLTHKSTKPSTKIDWETAAHNALMLAGQCIDAFEPCENKDALIAELKDIVPRNTKEKPGYRSLRAYFTGEADFEMARLSIALDALEEKK